MVRWKNRDWLNGHYELLVMYRDPYAWVEAAKTLWRLPHFSGVWTEREFDPEVDPFQDPQDILIACDLMEKNLLGVAHLRNGKSVPCGTAVGSSGWLALFLPLAGLELAYDVGGFPWRDQDRRWIGELNDWLVEIGRKVFHSVPFEIAAVGFETEVVGVLDVDISLPIDAPPKLHCGFLLPAGQEVRWYPPAGYATPSASARNEE